MTSSPPRLYMLDALRGLAALSVCWHHFTNGMPDFLPEGLVKASGVYGFLGVDIFFVISGFIIPYSLHRGGYELRHFGTFMLKRIVRLDPPYLVVLLVIILLGYASTATPGFRGPAFHLSVPQLALHLGYLNVFFGYPWLSPVFWTLAIELQYYLLAGLCYPLIAHPSSRVRGFLFAALAVIAVLTPARGFVFHWLFVFMLGMAAFQLRAGLLRRPAFLGLAVLFGAGAWLAEGPAVAATGVATALLIGLREIELGPVWIFFGTISYSLYLIHVTVGTRVINLSLRFVTSFPGKLAVLAAALGLATLVAWLLYLFVERPAQRWSSSFRYRRAPVAIPEA